MTNVAGAWGVYWQRNRSSLLFWRALERQLDVSIRTRGLIGGLHSHGPAVLNGPGLRVRPPPSLLRGLQAPPDSLSPFGGAASFKGPGLFNRLQNVVSRLRVRTPSGDARLTLQSWDESGAYDGCAGRREG